MENGLQVFENEQFGRVRTVIKTGAPWFVATDVCNALDLSNTAMALARLEDDEKGVSSIDTLGGKQDLTIINESGLYALVLGSRKPEAKQFKRWITHDIIPSIRKHGGYLTPDMVEQVLADPDTIIKLATQLKEERTKRIELEGVVREQIPLVEFANHVGDTTDLLTVAEFAKIAQNEQIPLGRNKLYDWLRKNKYLRDNNEPYQQYITQGLFKMKDVVKTSPYGANVFPTTFVTGKGQIYLIEKLRAEYCA